jgi:hypothetical protein
VTSKLSNGEKSLLYSVCKMTKGKYLHAGDVRFSGA